MRNLSWDLVRNINLKGFHYPSGKKKELKEQKAKNLKAKSKN